MLKSLIHFEMSHSAIRCSSAFTITSLNGQFIPLFVSLTLSLCLFHSLYVALALSNTYFIPNLLRLHHGAQFQTKKKKKSIDSNTDFSLISMTIFFSIVLHQDSYIYSNSSIYSHKCNLTGNCCGLSWSILGNRETILIKKTW